jgi:CheY-like chemotaxis protein
LRILIAEDEQRIAEGYMLTLTSRGHEVIVTEDGKSCVDRYTQEWKKASASKEAGQDISMPFDVVILDYRMPVMDGMEAAKRIFALVPEQRIIFASAYLKDTLLDSLRQLNCIVELLSKPFSLDDLTDMVEDEHLYRELRELNVDVKRLKSWNPSHAQIAGLLTGLTKLKSIDVKALKKSLAEQNRIKQPKSASPAR